MSLTGTERRGHNGGQNDALELQRGVRELIALSALTAAWHGTPTAKIPESLSDVLLKSVGAAFVFFRLKLTADGREVEGVRFRDGSTGPARSEALRAALSSYVDGGDEALPPVLPDALADDGTLRIAVQRVGSDAGMGFFVAASERPDFPTEMDRLLLEVGANQVAVILQHRQAEQSLKQSEEGRRVALAAGEDATRTKDEFITTVSNELRWAASIVEHSGDVILGKTLDGIVTSWNPGAEKLYGYTAAEMIGRPVSVLVPPDRHDEVPQILERLRRGGAVTDYETQRVTKAGRQIDVSLRISPIRDSSGALIGASTIARDISERKALRQAEVKLAHISRVATMGELATSIAHEVNQPLAAIVNDGGACLRWLQSHPPALDDARESVRHMIADANRASHVIARIRTLLARQPSIKVPFDPNDLVRDTAALLQSETARLAVILRTDLEADLPYVVGDRIQIQQVLINLIVNALDAMSSIDDRPRSLAVRSVRGGSSTVLVAVRDAGAGVTPDLLDRIFEAFYTTKADGLGMGLAISRSMIEEHGGHLWAIAHDGPGLTVQFTMPSAGEEG
jgi:two-component system, LuxR family, sensor kinase FixL